MFNKKVWRGVTTLVTFLLVFTLLGSSIANSYSAAVNSFLRIETNKVLNPGDPGYPSDVAGNTTDTQYYTSKFLVDGEFTAEGQAALIEAGFEQNILEMEEGAVLMYNKDNALPLSKSESISFFGHASVEPLQRSLSAGSLIMDSSTLPFYSGDASFDYSFDIPTAMEAVGFKINETLYAALKASETSNGFAGLGGRWSGRGQSISAAGMEDPISLYTDDLKTTWANDYQVAIMTLARAGCENRDLAMYDGDRNALSLSVEEEDIMKMLKAEKDAGRIKKIIVLLNCGTSMEVNWIEEYDVDAMVYVGALGSHGAIGVASILSGETNPSGRLTDTYAVSAMSSPAAVNANDNTQTYLNVDEIREKINGGEMSAFGFDDDEKADYMSFRAEGIYIGYKYYETRYEDYVYNQGNASGQNGASNGASEWNYDNEVTFAFGRGLSYTTFEQTLDNVNYNADDDTYELTVTVTNTGDVAGKSSVQVYAQTPYGDYEKQNKVEKSAVTFVGFNKTKELAPGESETLTITVDRYFLASYDYTAAKGYILSGGDYYFAIGEDAHDALNNIIMSKGVTADEAARMSGSGDASKAYKFSLAFDDAAYKVSETGVTVTNQFDDCDLNYWIDGAGTYVTRSDWNGTFPMAPTVVAATDEMIEVLSGELYEKPADAPTLAEATANIAKTPATDAPLKLVAMKDVPYDDPLWDEYMNQLTLEEICSTISDHQGTYGISSVGLPDMAVADGCDGFRGKGPDAHLFDYEDKTGKYGTGVVPADSLEAVRFAGNAILAGSFNTDLYRERGELSAENAIWKDFSVAWNVGVDIHRTPFSGRNFEYMSEDPNLVYLASIPQVEAAQQGGLICAPKHAAGNDQEYQRIGVSQFFNEQGWREGSLRASEGALRVAKAMSYMESFSRIGLVGCPSSEAYNTNVVFYEWGFRGNAITDSKDDTGTYQSHLASILAAGTDNWCFDQETVLPAALVQLLTETDDGNLFQYAYSAAKDYHYMVSRSNLMNGLSTDTVIVAVTPWWQTALTAAIVVLAVLEVAGVVMLVISKSKEGRK